MTPERLAEIRAASGEGSADWSDPITDARDLLAEVDQLLRWKSEATEVLNAWENVWVAAGEPGRLGESKAKATAAEVERLQAQVAALTSALERTEANFRAAVQSLPVRDMAENLAENRAALASGGDS